MVQLKRERKKNQNKFEGYYIMKTCFIISPIGEKNSDIRKRSDEILKYIIKPIIQDEFNYNTIRADEISEMGIITDQIIQHIVYNDLVVCDLTGGNPNVYYEIAIRHVIQKPFIQIIDENEKPSFDLAGTRVIPVNHKNLSGADQAKKDLRSFMEKLNLQTGKVETVTSKIINLELGKFDNSPINKIQYFAHEMNSLSQSLLDILGNSQFQEFELIKNKLEEGDRFMNALLSNFSHELRTPLNAILGFTELILTNVNKNENLERYANNIRNNGRYMLNIIGDIIDLSLFTAGRVKVNIESIDVHFLMKEIFNYYNSKVILEKPTIKLIINKPSKTELRFLTDNYKLKQAISNILDNAIKFTSEGTVEIEYFIKHDVFYCNIKDTGIGIETKNPSYIFKKFSQVETGLSKKYEGLGIGLTLTNEIIKLLKGRIWYESKIEEGTTFHISIPSSK